MNRLCLAAERPLVESGTAGYLGQVGCQATKEEAPWPLGALVDWQPGGVVWGGGACLTRNTVRSEGDLWVHSDRKRRRGS